MILGNKCDLEEDREVTKTESNELAKKLNVKHYEGSAKTRLNIEECFFELTRLTRFFDEERVQTKKEKKNCFIF